MNCFAAFIVAYHNSSFTFYINIMGIYLESVIKRFGSYKALAERTFEQLSEDDLYWQYNGASNSIAIIVKHMAGNMLSRWTDFLSTDGEKPWRNRDDEFEAGEKSRVQLLAYWEEGWQRMLDTLQSLKDEDLEKTIYIRGEAHTAMDAINRQLAHIPYHVGQIVYIGKMLAGDNWESLSIPKGQSAAFNGETSGKSVK